MLVLPCSAKFRYDEGNTHTHMHTHQVRIRRFLYNRPSRVVLLGYHCTIALTGSFMHGFSNAEPAYIGVCYGTCLTLIVT